MRYYVLSWNENGEGLDYVSQIGWIPKYQKNLFTTDHLANLCNSTSA